MPSDESYLIIGGCGFLGRHIVEQLQARGETQISVFDIVQRHFDRSVQPSAIYGVHPKLIECHLAMLRSMLEIYRSLRILRMR